MLTALHGDYFFKSQNVAYIIKHLTDKAAQLLIQTTVLSKLEFCKIEDPEQHSTFHCQIIIILACIYRKL